MVAIPLNILHLYQSNESEISTYWEKSAGGKSVIALLIPRAYQSTLFFSLFENSF